MDSDLLTWMVEHRMQWLTVVFWSVTTAGNTVAMFLWSTVGVLVLLRARRRMDALLVAWSMLTGWGLMSALKWIFARDRPPVPDRLVVISTHSFPSGHAMMSALLATVAIAVLRRSASGWLHRPALLALPVAASAAIGFSRIYLGAHWATDVLAGWVFGVAWGLLWIYAVTVTEFSWRSHFAGR